MSTRRLAALAVVLACAGTVSGWLAADRQQATLTAAVPEGPARLVVDVADDQRRGTPPIIIVDPVAIAGGDRWLEWDGPALAMPVIGDAALPQVGSRLVVGGTVRSRPRLVRGDPVAGTITQARIESVLPSPSPILRLGNLVRSRVGDVVGRSSDGRALLSGFLIGDVADVEATDLDAMRRSGLTHYVAVSGSNVALFLGGLWLLLGPLRLGIRARAAVGVAGVVVFVVATRWEPSVLRASVMAVLLFGGGAVGLPLLPWTALAGAIILLVAVSGQLVLDVGFQLSVVATAGVLLGVRLFADRRPRALWGGFGAAIGAQIAVTPLLLLHFGTVPLLSPVANLAAAPLVATATSTGAVAVLAGSTWMAGLAAEMAAAVLALARVTAQWPQLGVVGVMALGAAAALARLRPLRPWLAIGLVAFVALPVVQPHAPPQVATATFLDIGQGDATLIEDPSGAVILVDGGRDPSLLSHELRQRRIRRIDLLVATHGDADHAGGFSGILDAVGIGAIWIPDHPDLGPILVELLAEAERLGVPVAVPGPGAVVDLGDVAVEVIGPRRRYQAQNDGSIVLWVEAGRTLLLAGDVGAVAQRELPDLDPDILLVPHHGSSTTDLAWLRRTVGDVAVVSVGENTHGHPAPDVMAVLIESGAAVHVTRDDGDVAVPLG